MHAESVGEITGQCFTPNHSLAHHVVLRIYLNIKIKLIKSWPFLGTHHRLITFAPKQLRVCEVEVPVLDVVVREVAVEVVEVLLICVKQHFSMLVQKKQQFQHTLFVDKY